MTGALSSSDKPAGLNRSDFDASIMLSLRFYISPLEGGATNDEKGEIIARQNTERFSNPPPGNIFPEKMGPNIQVVDHKPFLQVAEIRHVMEDHADEKNRDGQNGGRGRLDVKAREHEGQAHQRDRFEGHEEMDAGKPF